MNVANEMEYPRQRDCPLIADAWLFTIRAAHCVDIPGTRVVKIDPRMEDPVKHTHKNHEIEVSTRDNGDFIEASAKFKPMTGYLGTFSIWGRFPSLEAAEQTVLEEAKRIIDHHIK
jgi:hypothetical protein